MSELETPLTPEQEQHINQQGDELIAEWAAWEYEHWPSRFIEGEDEERHRGKLEQLHRTAVMALALTRRARANQEIAKALNEQYNPTEHLRIRKEY